MDPQTVLKFQSFETSGFLNPEDFNCDIFQGLDLNTTNKPPNPNDLSIYSTNCSSKNTPEHYPFHLEDSKEIDEDTESRDSRVPKVKKSIYKKNYEPIYDNQSIYRYEDNPDEYRKARKRLQNRESACRVRSRKKTHMEQVEDEMREIKRRNEELMLYNASLTAENNLLKQQVAFLQKLVIKTGKDPEELNFSPESDPKYILPMTQERIRPETQHSMSRHFSILGIFTILIFVVSGGFQRNNEGNSFNGQFRGDFERGVKSFDQETIDYLVGQYEVWKFVSLGVKYAVMGVYCAYFCWIVYQFLIKKYVKLKIKEI